jgi:predicted acetyltransferase
MEVRRIRPEEKVAASLISTVVFLDERGEDYREMLKDPLAHSDGYENIWAAFDDTGKMTAELTVHNFTMRYDGHEVGMGGVGGVGTLPEYRKGGYIRRIFEKALPDMRERGMVFSFLYPFSFAFYRKFGYELCRAHNRIKLPVGTFRNFPFPDGITQYFPGDDIAPYAEIYKVFAQDKNLSIVRDENAWKHFLEKDPYVKKQYTYLHRATMPAGGETESRKNTPGKKADIPPADGYLVFTVGDDDGNVLDVKELAWTTIDGLKALFGFIGGLSPQFSNFKWSAPSAFTLSSLFPESYDIEIRHSPGGMNRVVNVPKALELLRVPEGAGRVVINVNDKFMPVNSGVYAVEWESGAVSVKTTDRPPDMETDVETLAQLVTGFLTPEQAQYRAGVKIHGNRGALTALFPHKDLYIREYF